MRIYDILPVGEENAIPGEEIERRLGITRRERRAMAAQELENGLFVLYTTTRPGGYFRPAEGEKAAVGEVRGRPSQSRLRRASSPFREAKRPRRRSAACRFHKNKCFRVALYNSTEGDQIRLNFFTLVGESNRCAHPRPVLQ